MTIVNDWTNGDIGYWYCIIACITIGTTASKSPTNIVWLSWNLRWNWNTYCFQCQINCMIVIIRRLHFTDFISNCRCECLQWFIPYHFFIYYHTRWRPGKVLPTWFNLGNNYSILLVLFNILTLFPRINSRLGSEITTTISIGILPLTSSTNKWSTTNSSIYM